MSDLIDPFEILPVEDPPFDEILDSPSGSASTAGSSGFGETPREDGRVLDDVRLWLSRFVSVMNPSDLDLLTLWAAHTHLCLETYTSPRLLLTSSMPGSGKTTVLEHLERLCLNPVQAASLSSPALLVRMLDAGLRTVLIDEADRSLAQDKEGVGELIAVLNSGYKRGATRPVLIANNGDWIAKEMSTFSPVCMAGNSPNLPDDTITRTVRVLLMPDHEGRVEESDWEMLDDEARALGRRLAAWSDQVRELVRANRPPLPTGIVARARERWSPLNRVAFAAGGRWPAVVATLAVNEQAELEIERDLGIISEKPHIVLARDLFEIWPDGETFVPTSRLIEALIGHHPQSWSIVSTFGKDLTPQRMGRMLSKEFRILPARPNTNGPRGYVRAALDPAWRSLGLGVPRKPDELAFPAEPDEALR